MSIINYTISVHPFTATNPTPPQIHDSLLLSIICLCIYAYMLINTENF